MKHSGIIALFLLFSSACISQTKSIDSSKYADIIKEQADSMGQLLLKKDLKAFSKFSYPKIVEMMGGESKMIEVLEAGLSKMESEGTSFLNANFGEPSKIIIKGNEMQCTIPQQIEMKVLNGRLI